MTRWGQMALGWLLACGLVLLGLSVPAHFRALSPVVIVEAGKESLQVEELAADYLVAGQRGPLDLMLAAEVEIPLSPAEQARLEDLLAQTQLDLTGGPAPYFEQFLATLPPGTEAASLVELLLPRAHRAELLRFLSQSQNAAVRNLLQTRELSDYRQFLPVFTPSGVPLDTAILLTALLEQSGRLTPPLARELRSLVNRALLSDQAALAELERTYLSVLMLGKRLNWTQLTELVFLVEDAAELEALAVLSRESGERWPLYYTATLLAGDPEGVASYRQRFGSDADRVLSFAAEKGRGAVQRVLTTEQRLYTPPRWLAALPEGWFFARGFFDTLAANAPPWALALKGAFFVGAMLILVSGWPAHWTRPGSAWVRSIGAGQLTLAVLLAMLGWWSLEPQFFEDLGQEPGRVTLNLANLLPLDNAGRPTPTAFMMDQANLIAFLLFLVLQAIVFVLSLRRLQQIRALKVTATTKIGLLDNEEVLFDLGLYVGLAGTVASLVLVVLNLISASLMTAYASTLFGIVFVAILKVIFLRPYRGQLVLQVERENPAIVVPAPAEVP